jgi:outer membrane protein insertion porin family
MSTVTVRAACGLLVVLGTIALGGTAFAQEPAAGPIVREVRFDGLETITRAYVDSVVRTAVGRPYDRPTADADVSRLLTTGRFATAEVRTESVPDGVAVVFDVRERPRVTSIRVEGNHKFGSKKLLKMVPVQVGDALDPFNVRQGVEAIEQAYRDAGYGQAAVTWNETTSRETGELVYTIEEGPHIRIRKIIFEGAASFPEQELNKHVTSKTYLWILRDGKFDEETVESDAASVQSYYRGQGFLDARVSYRLEMSENQQDLTIVFSVVEGTRYVVESVELTGFAAFTEDELRSLITVTVGAPILQKQMDDSAKALQDKYGALGYIYAEVKPVRVFSDTPSYVRVTYDITEGTQYHVGRIVVRGNERTKDKVVRRALEIYPEELFNMPKAKEAEETLRQTQIFTSASVAAVGDEADVRDALVTVDEARKAGDFVFGFGVTSNSGLVGSIVLEIRNFDLFDTPRSLSEFFKLRSFYGAGQRLRIEAQPGTELNRFRIDFTEPYFLDKPVRFDYSVYYFERGRESYDEERIGNTVSFGKRLRTGLLKGWYGELALRVENAVIDGLELLAPRDVRKDEGSHLFTSLKTTIVKDRTDSRLLPTKGDRLRLSYEQFGVLGGDVFGKANAAYTRHFTLHTDEQERKSVLTLRGVTGYVVGDAPVIERFYAGGIGSLRGFDFRGISPRQGLKDRPVGGDFLLLATAEYSFPLYTELLRGLVFSDMGTVEEDFGVSTWRMSVGVGVRLQLEFFGPVPMEFDFALPVSKDEDDDTQVFSFFVGATF